ncbi:peptidoglycan DD-metalloendopeptidase family protein [Candidatus Kaiserbacteria bacterium]|nr:peptidoglycan DD-metalloendopeptidase family protein [Candidatus Kaiserbacteria bacterium]
MVYQRASRLILEFVPLFLIVAVPVSVHAGVFSSLFLQNETAVAVSQPQVAGAQTVALLKATRAIDRDSAAGGGDVLVEDGALVPSGDIDTNDTDAKSRTSGGEISLYVVRPADTLSQIAEMFDVSAKTVLWANDIRDPEIIQPGDTLIILPITGVQHVVKAGDTVSSIAKKYDGDVEDILAYNQLASANDISVGDTVVIPGGAMHTTVQTSGAGGGQRVVATGSGSAGYINPLPGSVRTQGIHGYNAVDLGASVGAPIRAAAAGDVIVAKGSGYNGGYGLYVVVHHANGTQTLYAHMSSLAVALGDSVSQGETIGYVGNTGRSTGPHLHFEVRGASNPF